MGSVVKEVLDNDLRKRRNAANTVFQATTGNCREDVTAETGYSVFLSYYVRKGRKSHKLDNRPFCHI